MISFLLGVILGGIVGVLFDRLWVEYERLARADIEPSWHESDGECGIQLRIRNVG